MSISSKYGGGSRASDEDGKSAVSVKVGRFAIVPSVVVSTKNVNDSADSGRA